MSILLSLLTIANLSFAQDYGEYEDYQSFTDGQYVSQSWGFNFAPSLMSMDISENNQVSGATASDRSRTLTLYDLRLGHVFRRGFYFGIVYSAETQDINTSAPETSRISYGVSGGFLRRGWAIFFHYYVQSTQTVDSATATFGEYAKGAGLQVDLAYHFKLNKYFSIGPQITYKTFTYNEAENAATSVDSSADSTHTVLTPMLSVMVLFWRS